MLEVPQASYSFAVLPFNPALPACASSISGVDDEIRQVPEDQAEAQEAWERLTDDPDIRGIEAVRIEGPAGWYWNITVWVAEFLRGDSLEAELRQRLDSALRGVDGVDDVAEEDREVWYVTGTPSGKDLVRAAAQVVDDLAGRARALIASFDAR
jgi:hypothetical protein